MAIGAEVVAIGSAPGDSGSEWSQEGRLSAILEFYGKVGAKSDQARTCTATLNSRYGTPGRFLWSSWDEQKGSSVPRIEAAVREAEKQLQATLDAQGVSY